MMTPYFVAILTNTSTAISIQNVMEFGVCVANNGAHQRSSIFLRYFKLWPLFDICTLTLHLISFKMDFNSLVNIISSQTSAVEISLWTHSCVIKLLTTYPFEVQCHDTNFMCVYSWLLWNCCYSFCIFLFTVVWTLHWIGFSCLSCRIRKYLLP